MIYSYQQNNKFGHLLLDTKMPRSANLYFSKIQSYVEQIQWIRENIGRHNVKWSVNYGYVYCGKKIYQKNFKGKKRRNGWIWTNSRYVLQWCFQDKDDAMAFMLRWL